MSLIFVFGSNREGRHGMGAALHAKLYKGAIYGQARGLQGNSYAIVTKELRKDFEPVDLAEIEGEVDDFLVFAKARPDDLFQVTAIGCNLAGFKPWQIAPLFKNRPSNVILPIEFIEALEGD